MAREGADGGTAAGASMSFHLNDAAAMLDKCFEVLGATEPNVSRAIEKAKNMFQQGLCAEALDVAVDALGQCSCDASSLVSDLKTARSQLELADAQFNGTTKEIAAIKSEVGQLKKGMNSLLKERDQAESRRARQRRKILLGQIAYTMGKVIHKYVLQNEGPPVTLAEMLAESVDLNEVQQQRWALLRNKLQQWCNLSRLKRVDKYLRKLRFEPAHGTMDELRDTSTADLMAWAASECSAEWTQFVKEYVGVVAKLTEPGRPLNISAGAIEKVLGIQMGPRQH